MKKDPFYSSSVYRYKTDYSSTFDDEMQKCDEESSSQSNTIIKVENFSEADTSDEGWTDLTVNTPLPKSK